MSLADAECREDSSENLIGCRLTSYFSQTAERVVKPHKYKFLAGLRLKQGKGRLNGVDGALQQIMMPGICDKQALALPVSVRKRLQYGGPQTLKSRPTLRRDGDDFGAISVMAVLEANFGKVSEVTLIQSDYVSRIASLTQDNLVSVAQRFGTVDYDD